MNQPTTTPQFLLNFLEALQEFSDQGYILAAVPAESVEVGDYLVTYFCGFESDDSPKRTRAVRCEKVVATGSVQGSGPQLSRQTIALEGNPDIQQYQDNPDVLVLRERAPL